jgi:hypothetical protein
MLDREKIVAVLRRRFPGAGPDQIAAATNAIIGLEDEWEEVAGDQGLTPSIACRERCYLSQAGQRGARFRVFTRRVD